MYRLALILSLIILSSGTIFSQEILLKGDNTSMVNLYGDAKLLSIELQSNPKKQIKTHKAKGFRIQTYYGNDKNEATNVRINLNKKFPKHLPELIFESPNYWVRLGNFVTEEDAETFLKTISKDYPNAVIIPDQITITTP